MLITFMNLVITSGSALWALAAPVLLPMLMLIPYFAMALGFIQQYRKSAGIGTLASVTIPIAVVVWVAFFVAWYLLGIPLGIG